MQLLQNTVFFLIELMLLMLLLFIAGAEQVAEATVAKHCSFPDRTDVANVESRG